MSEYTPTTGHVRVAYQDHQDFQSVVKGLDRPGDVEAGREFDRWLAQHDAEVKAEVLEKRWVCQVARSGYHNGASCRPNDAHNDWGCDYYYEASIRATEYETGADR